MASMTWYEKSISASLLKERLEELKLQDAEDRKIRDHCIAHCEILKEIEEEMKIV